MSTGPGPGRGPGPRPGPGPGAREGKKNKNKKKTEPKWSWIAGAAGSWVTALAITTDSNCLVDTYPNAHTQAHTQAHSHTDVLIPDKQSNVKVYYVYAIRIRNVCLTWANGATKRLEITHKEHSQSQIRLQFKLLSARKKAERERESKGEGK